MALREFHDVLQHSTEWHAARRGMVTASAVGKLVTSRTVAVAHNDESRGLTALLVAERVTGYTDPTYANFDMLRGVEDEPVARDEYAKAHAPVTELGFMVRDDWGFRIGYSPDGLVGDDGLIEIKSRRSKKQLQTIVDGVVPVENVAQCQAGLLVSGREWLDYVSFCPGMPLWVHRVTPDKRWQAAIVAAVTEFEENAAAMEAAYREATGGLAVTEQRSDMDVVS